MASDLPAAVPPFEPDPAVKAVIDRMSRIRIAPVKILAFSMVGLWCSWRATLVQVVLGVVFVPTMVGSLAALLARPPRNIQSLDMDGELLALASKYLHRPQPRLALQRGLGTKQRAMVRGWGQQTTIVVSIATKKLWEDNHTAHLGQLVHELGHVWAQDTRSYYRAQGYLVFAAFSATLLFILGFRPQNFLVGLLFLSCLSLVSLRGYLRHREHSADLLGAQIVGAGQVEALSDAENPDSSRLKRALGTHPHVSARAELFKDPGYIYRNGATTVMFCLSACAAFGVLALSQTFVNLFRSSRPHFDIATMVLSLVILALVGPVVQFSELIGDANKSWRRNIARSMIWGGIVVLQIFVGAFPIEWRSILLGLVGIEVVARLTAALSGVAGAISVLVSDPVLKRRLGVGNLLAGLPMSFAWGFIVLAETSGWIRNSLSTILH